jgi:hypothetical protein
MHVRSGARVPMLDVDASDGILGLLNSLLDTMLEASPNLRPSIIEINSKFAYFIRVMMSAR